MAIGNQGRVLRIQQGQELQFHTSRDICCEYSLLNPAYQQAGHALIEILNHTKVFHERTKDATNNEKELFEYGGNIILFAAPRGGGKTRMMLSFSHVLENSMHAIAPLCLGKALDKNVCQGCKDPYFFAIRDPNKNMHSWLKESSFIITEPIAPAALEKKQSILYVVLSRLYRYVEKLLNRHYGSIDFSDNQRNELQRRFHKCLSGINGLKNPDDSMPEDLSVLQDISDGLSLRYHFHQLISKILEIAVPTSKAVNRYLVLQIDDADSKIDGVYEVFEDIRKYLLVPNLVILLSADLDFLHHTITEEHLRCFDSLQRFEKEYAQDYSGELSRIARKYIDKLIPPSHQVNLPELGKTTYPDVKEIRLDYVKENGEDILRDMKEGVEADYWTLETSILKLIYRKTGILFISPTAYLHNIIPRTPRGINQLLFILNSMEDIPKITHFEQADFSNDVLAQIAIAEHNLARFSEYFTHDWIKVKIKNSEDRDFLNKFSNMANSSLTYMVLEHLKKKYPDVKALPDNQHIVMNRHTLDMSIQQCEMSHRTPEDFWLFFAIRTLLTLNSHRLILREKKNKLQNNPAIFPFIFDFNEDTIFVTDYIGLNKDSKDACHDQEVKDVINAYTPSMTSDSKLTGGLSQILFTTDVLSSSRISYLNLFSVLLQLRKAFPEVSFSEDMQRDLYFLQEYALTIVANWDVYGKLYRETLQLCTYAIEIYKTIDPTSFSKQYASLSTQDSAGQSAQESDKDSDGQSTQEPVEDSDGQSTQKPVEDSDEQSAQKSVEDSDGQSAQKSVEDSDGRSTQKPTKPSSEQTTDQTTDQPLSGATVPVKTACFIKALEKRLMEYNKNTIEDVFCIDDLYTAIAGLAGTKESGSVNILVELNKCFGDLQNTDNTPINAPSSTDPGTFGDSLDQGQQQKN